MLKSESDAKANASVIVFNIQKKLDGKEFLTNNEERMLKGICCITEKYALKGSCQKKF